MDAHNTKSTGTSASPKLEAIRYLSNKSGVLATIALDKDTGAILQTSGELSSFRSTSATRATATSALAQPGSNGEAETGGIEETAMMVWNFLKAAGGLVWSLDAEVGHALLGSPEHNNNWR